NSAIISGTGLVQAGVLKVETTKFVYYQENDMWVGWFEEYPDYKSQGKTLDELKENLKEIHEDLSTRKIPNVRRYGELVIG
ncbi:MAG: hypothetical protein Q7R50_01320, partial [Dehalococcoidales bacterium]|nr:hypothetical protein [Dehalococcoidales bacterium]